MKIYFVRHGETDSNIKGLVNGLNDEHLNQNGIEQAHKLAKELVDLEYDVIISSPLSRTLETAEIINVRKKEVIIDELLVERDAGDLTLKPIPAPETDWWNCYPKKNYVNAETVFDVVNRVEKILVKIKTQYNNQDVLVVTHGGILRTLAYLYNKSNHDLSKYNFKNCQIVDMDDFENNNYFKLH